MSSLAADMQSLSPIIVTAPTARNGVTLLQRLLNSSRQIIVYGENTMIMDHLPKIVRSATFFYKASGEEVKEARRKFLSETTESWTSNLWPDMEAFMLRMYDAFYAGTLVYEQSTRQYGYERWGIKIPMTNPGMVEIFRVLMPNCSVVGIYRNPYEVVRSAKARNFITDLAGVQHYAAQWAANLRALQEKSGEVHLIAHDDLAANPEAVITKLERVTGVTGMDRTVMDRRINSFEGYVEPEPLTDEEAAAIQAHAGEMMVKMGYQVEQTV